MVIKNIYKNLYKNLFWMLALFFIFLAKTSIAQTPIINVTVSPALVRNGEAVTYKIQVTTEDRGRISPPQLGDLKDFEILSSTLTESPRITSINGVTKYVNRSEFIYFMRPLRLGKLKIPSAQLSVGKRTLRTDSVEVEVTRLSNGQATSPRFNQNPPPALGQRNFPNLPPGILDDEDAPQEQQPDPPGNPGFEAPKNESFFVRGFTDKQEYYEGELVDLNYFLFQRTRNLNTPEMAKFPEFKGFVKEELYIARSFEMERVQLGNEILLRSRLARYALFPVKIGKLSIDSLKFRAQVFRSMEDLVESLLQGTPAPTFGPPIPMEKSSGTLEVLIKPLPASPPGTAFTGGVGNFALSVTPPPSSVTTQQPFSILMVIKGRGNLKLLQEIPLNLPKGLELYQVKGGGGELDENGSGSRTFEYLILPREAGQYSIKVPNWTFFNPDKGKYEVVESPAIEINAVGSSFAEQTPINNNEPQGSKLSALLSGPQKFTLRKNPLESSWAGSAWIWYVASAAYLALALVFFQMRRRENESEFLKNRPWEATARRILAKDYRNVVGLAVLIDNFVRQRISGVFSNHGLHSESTPDDFLKVLKDNTKSEAAPLLRDLKAFWIELDLLRFGGKSGKSLSVSESEDIYPRAKSLCEKILALVQFKETEELDS